MKKLFIISMATFLFHCSTNKDSGNGLVGTWEVDANGIKYQFTLNSDSTISETLFGTTGKWRCQAGDSVKQERAQLLIKNESGVERWLYINGISESSLELAQAETPYSFKRASDDAKSAEPFDQFRLLFNSGGQDWLIVPLAKERINQLIGQFVPEHEMFTNGQALISTDSRFVAVLYNYMSSGIAVFNPQTKERLDYQELFRGEGCNSSYLIPNETGEPIIEQTSVCEEGDPTKKYFTIDNQGKIKPSEGNTSSKETQVLRRLMLQAWGSGKYKETNEGSKIEFNGDDGQDNGVDHRTAGTFKQRGDWLTVILEETLDMGGGNRSSLFKKEGDEWISKTTPELLPGVPDTLIDLNGDGKEELIMRDRQWNSAGANITYVFYAQNAAGQFKKLSDIAKSTEGYSPMQFSEDNKCIVSELKYALAGDVVVIKISTTRSWWIAQENSSGSEKEVMTYSWDGTTFGIEN